MKCGSAEITVALAGNPNVGKSTLFNAMTGLRQHTGNWTGKTVAMAAGVCRHSNTTIEVVDLPGTYSLTPRSSEEAVARDYLYHESPDVVVAVCDATCLSRSLILALQIMEQCPRTVVCVNLMDEATAKGIVVDRCRLEEDLGVPVVTVSARDKRAVATVMGAVERVLTTTPAPQPVRYTPPIEAALAVTDAPRGVVLRALESEAFAQTAGISRAAALQAAEENGLPKDRVAQAVAACTVLHAEAIAADAVTINETKATRRDRRVDRVLTGRLTGAPLMLGLLCLVLWLTVFGANALSNWLNIFFDWGRCGLDALCAHFAAPWWLRGVLVDGAYTVLSWVVAVMLPPMAIFFPLFTLLEDVGYLPRVAFNLDGGFRRACSCGKQALTMCMGFGCNAVGVTGCRIMDSPRERAVASVTNSLVPCNGRFPLLITLITLFFAGNRHRSLSAALWLTVVVMLGVGMTLLCSFLLSKTWFRGMQSSFALELPPYRTPRVGQVIWRSVWDRTVFVLGRAAAVAAPAGVIIWLLANVTVGGVPLMQHAAQFLDPFARWIGLDGAILFAFILGFPANEIVLPLLVMMYQEGHALSQVGYTALYDVLTVHGWTPLTALCMILFSLFHWPCSTTCLTVWKETRSIKQTAVAIWLPTMLGITLCAVCSLVGRLF